MTNRLFTVLTLSMSLGLGAGTALLWAVGSGPDDASATPNNAIKGVSSVNASVEPIRGIQAVDSVTMQNLEAVLRMQQRSEEDDTKGGVSTAAGLMTMYYFEPGAEELEIDGRAELEELEMEGS